jgi:hypothetical protein
MLKRSLVDRRHGRLSCAFDREFDTSRGRSISGMPSPHGIPEVPTNLRMTRGELEGLRVFYWLWCINKFLKLGILEMLSYNFSFLSLVETWRILRVSL